MSERIFDEKIIHELRVVFCYEALDIFENMESVILRSQSSDEILTTIARSLHCLKGGSQAASFEMFALIIHDLEDVFSTSFFDERKKNFILRVIDRLRGAIQMFLEDDLAYSSSFHEIRNFSGSMKFYLTDK